MKLVIVESIIGSILALLGDTVYAGRTSGNLFAVVLEKNPVPPGQKKLLRGASKSLPSCRVLFFDIFGSEFPYAGLHFGTLQRGLWKRPCVSILIRCLKNQLVYKKLFLLLFF